VFSAAVFEGEGWVVTVADEKTPDRSLKRRHDANLLIIQWVRFLDSARLVTTILIWKESS
jgi:hypothetical protein